MLNCKYYIDTFNFLNPFDNLGSECVPEEDYTNILLHQRKESYYSVQKLYLSVFSPLKSYEASPNYKNAANSPILP